MILNILGRNIYVRKEIIAAAISVAVIVLGLVGFYVSKEGNALIIEGAGEQMDISEPAAGSSPSKEPLKEDALNESTGKENQESDKTLSSEDEIKVYVVGSVNNPGIVTLEKGQIIDDAIRLAGGFTSEAAPDCINLVYKLRDNVMINVRSKGELEGRENSAAADSQQYETAEAGRGVEVITDSRGAISEEGTNSGAAKKININTALEKELDTLPGIGPEMAKDIIAYRANSGRFNKIEDIMKVSGIKDSKFSKIKDLITAE